jgi:hypothetical protein
MALYQKMQRHLQAQAATMFVRSMMVLTPPKAAAVSDSTTTFKTSSRTLQVQLPPRVVERNGVLKCVPFAAVRQEIEALDIEMANRFAPRFPVICFVCLMQLTSNDDTFEMEMVSSDGYIQMQLLETTCDLLLALRDHQVCAENYMP